MRELLALVAMACRFPAAPTTQHFWENLKQGYDALSEIPVTRWDAQHYYDPKPGVTGKCATTKGYFLDDVRQFDADFFKVQPEDAEVMDPQQRILLELCYEAFYSAGYTRESLSGQKIGVFMGVTKSDYQNNVAEALVRQELTQKTVVTGILENLIAARIAHYFDLNGPALTLDTACSSSLVALHMAKESILAGDCEMALVGGINLNLNAPAFLGMSAAHALSPGLHYHVFDQRSSGFFMGEGGGVVLLKKRSQALIDQDTILAVLAGSSVNNDGRGISPMAPRSKTQQAALLSAYQDAGLSAAEITLIEAHGTGTPLGDAVEAQTLNAVFKGIENRPVLSTVKPNIGHLLSAAGMGSLIKVLLCFQHRQIPPLLHYGQPRKQLDLEAQGFRLNTELLTIPDGEPMIAGINGFGFGGTNAHIVLRAENRQVPASPYRQWVPAYQKKDYWVELQAAGLPGALSEMPVSAPPISTAEISAFEERWFEQDLPLAARSVLEPHLIMAHPFLAHEQAGLLEALQQVALPDEQVRLPCLSVADWSELEAKLSHDSRAYAWVLLLPLSPQALYAFIQTLAKSPLLARCLRLTVVTQGALPLASDPPQSLLENFVQSGLLWGAASELSLPVTQIDLDPTLDLAQQFSALARLLVQPQMPLQSALRAERGADRRELKLWQRTQRKVSLQTEPPLPSRIRPGGVYLITGGASGIGAHISESFAQRQTGLHLIAIGRRLATELPDLAALQARIAAQGSRLDYYRVDISEQAEVRLLCQQILRQYGRLNGVVHAAGQVSPGDLRRSAYSARLEGMAPKVKGLPYLREALLELSLVPDFCLAFSSLSAALPGYGRGLIDYVAANHFMDLYAASVARTQLPVQVIQWGPWQGAGMAAHPLLQQQLAAWGIQALLPAEGVAAFQAFIDGGYHQALILKTDQSLKALAERLPAVSGPAPFRPAEPVPLRVPLTPLLPLIGKVPLASDRLSDAAWAFSESPGSSIDRLSQPELEQRLQHLLQETLAESGQTVVIGPEDNLMDIGIDSLTAIELTKSLGDWGYQDLPFALFFEYQSVRELAHYLLTCCAEQVSTAEPLAEHKAFAKPELSDLDLSAHKSGEQRLHYPLSPIQQAFYLAQSLYERPNYSYFRLSLKRLLDPLLLEQACLDLLPDHEQLRAVFQQGLDANGLRLSYQILPMAQIRLPQQLIEIIPPAQRLAEFEDEFVNQLFDLSQTPLFRIALQAGQQGSHLLLLFHHIIFDGVSMLNFLQALWERYRALEQRLPLAPSIACETTYQDYVQGVQSYRDSAAFETACQDLTSYLKRPMAPNAFMNALAERYAALGPVAASSQQRKLSLVCTQRLNQVAEASQTPLQMLYLSAFFTALSQWSGQKQLWVQLASAGRQWPVPQIQNLIGSFAELFPLYADLNQLSGLELAQALRLQWNQSQPLQRVGSDQLARLAQQSGLALPFSFSFAHFDTSWMSAQDRDQIETTQIRGYHAQTQLGLLISENNQGFYYALNTPQGLFSDVELTDLCTQFEQALTELGVAETLPDFWSRFQAPPDQAPALLTPQTRWTYQQFRQSALQMARYLADQGLNSGDVLVFWGEAGPDSLSLLLACLALGVTWVPVDTQSPMLRLKAICAQARADLIVSDLPVSEPLPCLLLSLTQLTEAVQSDELMIYTAPVRRPDAIAYIIFTSGSTGQPKEVPILYTALMRYLEWAIGAFDYGPTDRVILSSSLAFDASLRPILATLMTGGCLCPLSDAVKRDSQRLLNWTQEARITVWSSVPSLWQGLIQALESQPGVAAQSSGERLPDLRLTQLGGEVLSPQWLQRWQALIGSERPLVNLYGPTETTLNATFYRVSGPHPQGQAIPIGQALPYLSCRVISVDDQALNPCAAGEIGELWVSGPTLTAGYLDSRSDSQDGPFVTFEGLRYYRTGDRVSQDAEGLFYYHGRQDRQLKLRGYRLEPAEIEARMLAFPNLLEAWVDIIQRPSGAQQLVACVRSALPFEAADREALQRHLAAALPDYMLPQQIYDLQHFPRLANGKCDLEALKQIALASDRETGLSDDLPLSQEPIAARVTAVWQTLLKQASFGEDADFFQLGGDSLLLMQAYLMLQQDWPHLPKIARFHSQRRWQDWVHLVEESFSTNAAVEIAERSKTPSLDVNFALSPSQMGFYLWHQHLKNDPSLWEARLQLEGELDPDLFRQALWAAAQRHQMLNVNLQATSPPIFVPSSEPRLRFHYQDLSAAADSAESQRQYLADHRLQHMDIFSDPLLHCHLLKQGPGHYLWLIQAHHILADGLSGLILGRDIFRAYRQLLAARQPAGAQRSGQTLAGSESTKTVSNNNAIYSIAPLRSQFSDYIALLAQTAGENSKHLDYWQRVFGHPYQAPDLRSATRQANLEQSPGDFFVIERRLSHSALAGFRQICQAASSTLFMGVLAAYQQALIRLTGQTDLIIGVAHHGRDYPLTDIDQIFGCFARTLPLRLPNPGNGLGIQAAQAHYQAAAQHPLDPVALMRQMERPPRLQSLLGSQFFISYVDMNPLLESEPVPGLRLDWSASGSHFQPSNQDTDLFLALKQQGESWVLTLNVHQAACNERRASEFLDQVIDAISVKGGASELLPAQASSSPQRARVQTLPFELAQTGPLDAALISYLPALDHIKRAVPGLGQTQIQALKNQLFSGQSAFWLETLQTPLGRSANLVLPFFANEIQPGQAKRILPAIDQARYQAQALGVRVVSLAGLLPALSSYGLDLPDFVNAAERAPQRLTTGHSTTVVAMLHTIRFALAQLERPLANCHLAVVGLGSIGEATLSALLASQPHPASLMLVDRMGSASRLEALAGRLQAGSQYARPIQVCFSQSGLPPEVYQADLILSAVSARQVINIAQLRPGTVVIDDSFPHCFEVQAAIERMQNQQDVLVIGGGLLALPGSHKQIYLPLPHPRLTSALTQVSLPACLPGCQLESLLLAAYPDLPETLGLVDPDKLLRYLPVLETAGIQAAPLHLEGYLVPAELIQRLSTTR